MKSLTIQILEVDASRLAEYATISSRVEVKAAFQLELVQSGMGILLYEIPVSPHLKDYDTHGETPMDWPIKDQVRQ